MTVKRFFFAASASASIFCFVLICSRSSAVSHALLSISK